MLDAHQRGEIPLERVIIETTGLADPAPILFSILTHPLLVHHYYIDMVIACLDAANGELHLQTSPESVKQIVSADRVIITKTDISTPEAVEFLQQRIMSLNPAARISTASRQKVGVDIFAEVDVFPQKDPPRLEQLRGQQQEPAGMHTTNVRSLSIQFVKPLDWLAFGIWLSMLLHKHGENMFRVKGIVDVGEQGPIVLNGVQHIIHPPRHLADWRDYEERNSQVVFIMRDIEPNLILDSLKAFQNLLGAEPEIKEINLDPFY
jgi:G3E family GTPase